MFKKILTLLPLMVGCIGDAPKAYTTHSALVSSQHVIPVAIDIQFSTTEQQLLKEALSEWNRVLNNQLQLEVYSDRFNMEENTISYLYNAHGFMLLKVSTLGSVMYNMEGGTVAISSHIGTGHEIYFLKEKVGPERLRQVALHEIGHILGAYHTTYGLMKHEYNANSYACVDYDTAKQVATYRSLDINQMNWCQ